MTVIVKVLRDRYYLSRCDTGHRAPQYRYQGGFDGHNPKKSADRREGKDCRRLRESDVSIHSLSGARDLTRRFLADPDRIVYTENAVRVCSGEFATPLGKFFTFSRTSSQRRPIMYYMRKGSSCGENAAAKKAHKIQASGYRAGPARRRDSVC